MEITDIINLPIVEYSQVADARRKAKALAKRLGFGVNTAEKVAIVATELSSNLAKHAKEGQLIIRPLECDDVLGIEMLSLDKGPGMQNVMKYMRDTFSTTGTSGIGLGAIARLSDCFDIYSQPDVGTAVLSHIWGDNLPLTENEYGTETGVVYLPKPGEIANGDSWAINRDQDKCTILVVDGIGHGTAASDASHKATRVFLENPALEPVQMANAIHAALHNTRGAAIAIAEIDIKEQVINYVGIGNISGCYVTPDNTSHQMVTLNGTMGYEIPRPRIFTYPFPFNNRASSTIIMHSDGLSNKWHLEDYPGILSKLPSIIAGVLFRDFYRETDDVTVVVIRLNLGEDLPRCI